MKVPLAIRSCLYQQTPSFVLDLYVLHWIYFVSLGKVHHVQDTITNLVETGENHNIMFIQCTYQVQNGGK